MPDCWKSHGTAHLHHFCSHIFQHPTDCSKARKLLCGGSQIFGWRGFGAQLHEVVLCLMAALGSGRTLILDSKGWSYAKEGWETVFQTINGNCSAPRTVAAQSRNIVI